MLSGSLEAGTLAVSAMFVLDFVSLFFNLFADWSWINRPTAKCYSEEAHESDEWHFFQEPMDLCLVNTLLLGSTHLYFPLCRFRCSVPVLSKPSSPWWTSVGLTPEWWRLGYITATQLSEPTFSGSVQLLGKTSVAIIRRAIATPEGNYMSLTRFTRWIYADTL